MLMMGCLSLWTSSYCVAQSADNDVMQSALFVAPSIIIALHWLPIINSVEFEQLYLTQLYPNMHSHKYA